MPSTSVTAIPRCAPASSAWRSSKAPSARCCFRPAWPRWPRCCSRISRSATTSWRCASATAAPTRCCAGGRALRLDLRPGRRPRARDLGARLSASRRGCSMVESPTNPTLSVVDLALAARARARARGSAVRGQHLRLAGRSAAAGTRRGSGGLQRHQVDRRPQRPDGRRGAGDGRASPQGLGGAQGVRRDPGSGRGVADRAQPEDAAAARGHRERRTRSSSRRGSPLIPGVAQVFYPGLRVASGARRWPRAR